MFYNRIAAIDHTMTRSGSRLVAVLVAPYCEYRRQQVGRTRDGKPVWGDWDQGVQKSMIFMSTIPRGDEEGSGFEGTLTRLQGPNGGHDAWRAHCYRTFDPPQGPNSLRYATQVHAEDHVINMFLNTWDKTQTLAASNQYGIAVDWLGGNFMVVYGLRRNPQGEPGQVLPCGPYATDPENSKVPCCQWVLDRMEIEYRFGIAANIPRPPEPQLPAYPPGGGSGAGPSGQGDGRGGEPPASGHRYPTGFTDLTSHIQYSDWDMSGVPGYNPAARAYHAAVQQWRAREAQTRGKRIIRHCSDMKKAAASSPFIPGKVPPAEGPPVSIIHYLRGWPVKAQKPPTASLAALSLNPGSTQKGPTQPAVKPPSGVAKAPTKQHANKAPPAAAAAAVKGNVQNTKAQPQQHANPQQAHGQQTGPRPVKSQQVKKKPQTLQVHPQPVHPQK
ncbi:hypothetical protein C8A03DRAFT_39376, partial [Achaetomium macrosporum]